MKKYGFQPPVIVPEDYFLGSGKLGSQEINPTGDWIAYLPKFEKQAEFYETNACVSYGTNSALEILHKFLYGIEPNNSDSFLATASETNPYSGNNPKKVSVTLRHKGCVAEEKRPYPDTLEKFYEPISQELYDLGADWLKDYEFGYEYVDKTKLREALKRSPIGCAVNAWSQNDKGEYIRLGASNHWVVLVWFDDFDRPVIWDSYDEGLKTLEKDYDLEFPMLYTLKKKPSPAEKEIAEYKAGGGNWFTQIINHLKAMFTWS